MMALSAAKGVKWLRTAATENLGLKLISLLIAVLLHSLVHGDEEAQRAMLVDVVALLPKPQAGKVLVSPLPNSVKVTVKGSRSRINAIRQGDFPPLQIDLRDGRGAYYEIDPQQIDRPAGVSVVQLEPRSFSLSWERLTTKDVPVVPAVERRPGSELVVKEEVRSEPSSVTVRGPTSEVGELAALETEPILLDALGTGAHRQRVALKRLPPHAEFVDTDNVTVELTVTREAAERQWSNQRVQVTGGRAARLRPVAVDVTLSGPSTSMNLVTQELVAPYVAVSELEPEGGPQPVEVQLRPLPAGISVVEISPREVMVTPQ